MQVSLFNGELLADAQGKLVGAIGLDGKEYLFSTNANAPSAAAQPTMNGTAAEFNGTGWNNTSGGDVRIINGHGVGSSLTFRATGIGGQTISIISTSNSALTGGGAFVVFDNVTGNYRLVLQNGYAGLHTSTPNVNAALDIFSTTRAFIPPRMTTAQKNAIAGPTPGMMVYDSTLNKLCIYGASAWETITSA